MARKSTAANVTWSAQPGPQTRFIQCPAFECLYGGAVGGGKSDGLLGDYSQGIPYGKGWRGIFLRRYLGDLEEIIERSKEIFGPVYGEGCWAESKKKWTFPSGATLIFRAIERKDDVLKFQGRQFTWIGWDELTQWASPYPYTYLFTRCRSPHGHPCRVRAATNPGGPGHAWVKARFIDPAPPNHGWKVRTKSGRQFWRVFIPSKLEDNRILMENDPNYEDRVYELDDPNLAEALRMGDWNIVAGAAFPEFDPRVHVVDPAPIPSDKPIWRSLDWGYVEPYAGGWYFPDNEGNIIMANEIYGWSGKPNVGTKEPPSEVRRKIENFEMMHEIWVPRGYLDGQCWEERGQTGFIVDELGGRELGWVAWKKRGREGRKMRKLACHQMLAVTNGSSRFKIMRHCKHFIRTIQALPLDDRNVEDVDTNAEDHHYDQWCGALQHRVKTRQQLREINRRVNRDRYLQGADLHGGGF